VWHGIFVLFGFNCLAPTDDGSAGSLKDPTNEMTPFGRFSFSASCGFVI
jgi:hypothetical protein